MNPTTHTSTAQNVREVFTFHGGDGYHLTVKFFGDGDLLMTQGDDIVVVTVDRLEALCALLNTHKRIVEEGRTNG